MLHEKNLGIDKDIIMVKYNNVEAEQATAVSELLKGVAEK